MITVEVRVDGTRLADTALELAAGEPTVLTDLSLTWGRDTTVDQPDAATVNLSVLDVAGGAGVLERVDVGRKLEVFSTGDISAGASTDVAVDGSYELTPPGPASPSRVTYTPSAVDARIVATVAAHGAQAVKATTTEYAASAMLWTGPAPFSDTDPAAWDAIPRFAAGQIWTWEVAVRPGPGVTAGVLPVAFPSPEPITGAATAGVTVETAPGDGNTWQTLTGTTGISPYGDDRWLGLRVSFYGFDTWSEHPGTWSTQVGTWEDRAGGAFDRVKIFAPPGALPREVLVFSGRITDLSAEVDPGEVRVDVTAVDQLAELGNVTVGSIPWPAEAFPARIGRIVAGLDVETRIDPTFDGFTVSWRDVDAQPAASLLTEHTAGVDGVLWSATHRSSGPYLWFEDPLSRAQLGTLVEASGVVSIVDADPNRVGTVNVDGCRVPEDPVRWVRDVSDVVTRVDATWLEQTLDTEGNQQPTEHTVTVTDPDGVLTYGDRRHQVATMLTTEAAAATVADRILTRAAVLRWRVQGVTLAVEPVAPGPATGEVLDLLDGTTRIGAPVVVSDVELWPERNVIAGYLDGGTYRYGAGGWVLELNLSTGAGLGASATWSDLAPSWSWSMFDPAITYASLWGVGV